MPGGALVQDYLERYPAPRVMLIDITSCDRINDELLAGFLPYTPTPSALMRSFIGNCRKWGGVVR